MSGVVKAGLADGRTLGGLGMLETKSVTLRYLESDRDTHTDYRPGGERVLGTDKLKLYFGGE